MHQHHSAYAALGEKLGEFRIKAGAYSSSGLFFFVHTYTYISYTPSDWVYLSELVLAPVPYLLGF